MTDDIALIDAETMAALKVLRGDNKKDANTVDKEFSSGLANQIVEALAAQKESSSTQTAELIKAVREQTAVLQKLTDMLQEKQTTTVVVVNKDKDQASSVASTAAETEPETVVESDDPNDETTAPVATAEATSKEEEVDDEKEEVQDDAKKVTLAVVENPVAATATQADAAAPFPIVRGPWGFVESADASERRSRLNKSNGSFRYLDKGEEPPQDAFVPVSNSQKREKGDALFGKVSDVELVGDSFGEHWDRMKCRVDQYGKLKPPLWAVTAKKSVRPYLPTLTIGGKSTIALNSGVYYLTMKYEQEAPVESVEAAIVIGEIAFDNSGSVLAPGAKWTKLLKGEKQKEGRTPPSRTKWYAAKVSKPWKNGDVLRFKVDTNTKTVVYTLTATGADEAEAGWRFENVLAFTNVPTYKNDLRAFAYCGGKGKISDSTVKLTIVDETPDRDSISTITDNEPKAVSADKPEAEALSEKAEPETKEPIDIMADTDAALETKE